MPNTNTDDTQTPKKDQQLLDFISRITAARNRVQNYINNPATAEFDLTLSEGAATSLSPHILLDCYNRALDEYEFYKNKRKSGAFEPDPNYFGDLEFNSGIYFKRPPSARDKIYSSDRSVEYVRDTLGEYAVYVEPKTKINSNLKRKIEWPHGGFKKCKVCFMVDRYPIVTSASLLVKILFADVETEHYKTFVTKLLSNSKTIEQSICKKIGLPIKDIYEFPASERHRLLKLTTTSEEQFRQDVQKRIKSKFKAISEEVEINNTLADKYPLYFNKASSFIEYRDNMAVAHIITENVEFDLFKLTASKTLDAGYPADKYPKLDRTLIDINGVKFEKCKLDIFWQLVNATAIMHAEGIAHRDLKLENILCKYNEKTQRIEIKIIDFGLSSPINDNSIDLRGTLGNIPPELFRHEFDQKLNTQGINEASKLLRKRVKESPDDLAINEVVNLFHQTHKTKISPELLPQPGNYTGPQDVWALGIMLQMMMYTSKLRTTQLPLADLFFNPAPTKRITAADALNKLATIPEMADIIAANTPALQNIPAVKPTTSQDQDPFIQALLNFKKHRNSMPEESTNIIFEYFDNMKKGCSQEQSYNIDTIYPVLIRLHTIISSNESTTKKYELLQEIVQDKTINFNVGAYTGRKLSEQEIIEHMQIEVMREFTEYYIDTALLAYNPNKLQLQSDSKENDIIFTLILQNAINCQAAIRSEKEHPFVKRFGA